MKDARPIDVDRAERLIAALAVDDETAAVKVLTESQLDRQETRLHVAVARIHVNAMRQLGQDQRAYGPARPSSPTYSDVERGLRIALARRLGDNDVLPILAAECAGPADVDMLILAQADALNFVLDKGVEDPEKFLTNWIVQVRELADVNERDDERDDD